MYSKEELSANSVVQLKDIAKQIGVKIKSGDNKETIINTIFNAQTEDSTLQQNVSVPVSSPAKRIEYIA